MSLFYATMINYDIGLKLNYELIICLSERGLGRFDALESYSGHFRQA